MTWQWSISTWSLATVQERIPGPNSSVLSPLNTQFCSLMSPNWVRKLIAEEGLEGLGWERVGIGEKRNYRCSQTVCVCVGGMCVTICVNCQRRQMNASRRGQHVLGGVVPKAGLHTY